MPLGPVRFSFYGEGRDKPTTGYLYLREIPDLGTWKITDYVYTSKTRQERYGTDMAYGIRLYLAQAASFVEKWHESQQAHVHEHATWSGRQHPATMLRKPGFRTVTVVQAYAGFVASVKKEHAALQRDVLVIEQEARQGGWLDLIGSEFKPLVVPEIVFPEPWGQVVRSVTAR